MLSLANTLNQANHFIHTKETKLAERPAGFLSYASSDDEHDGGRITEFRKRLCAELRLLTGEEFSIFQDRQNIAWGQNWKKLILESLGATSFLIPIITPSFFNSEECLDELERFLERERELERDDLVLPIYYVDCPIINKATIGNTRREKMARIITSRQHSDWRQLRLESMDSPQVHKAIAKLAFQVRELSERTGVKNKPDSKTIPGKKSRGVGRVSDAALEDAKRANNLRVDRIDMQVILNEFGDGEYTLKYHGIGVKGEGKARETILTRHVSYGQFGHFKVSSKDLPSLTVQTELKAVDNGESTEAVARIEFDQPLTEANGPINCELQMFLYGGFAVNKLEQEQRKVRYIDGMEWISYTVEHPLNELRMLLQSKTMIFPPSSVDVAVLNRMGKRQKRFEASARKALVVESHLILLSITNPQVGFRYEIRWKLPEPPNPSWQYLAPLPIRGQLLGSPSDMRKLLIHMAANGANSQFAQHFSRWILETRQDYLEKFGLNERPEDIDVSMHVLDDQKYRLKLVAGLYPYSSPLWSWAGFKPGTGLVGRAFKCNRIAFYRASGECEDQYVYIKHTDPIFSGIDLVAYEVLLCCPIHFGSQDHIIAIVNIGSKSIQSQLTKYAPGQDFDLWLKEISKSALRYIAQLITAYAQQESDLNPR